MTKISEIWAELENDTSVRTGLLMRRYSGSVLPDVFVALKVPEQVRCIAAAINGANLINLAAFSNLKDIAIEVVPAEAEHKKDMMVFKLLNSQHKDIFSVLSEDLILSVSTLTDDKHLVRVLL